MYSRKAHMQRPALKCTPGHLGLQTLCPGGGMRVEKSLMKILDATSRACDHNRKDKHMLPQGPSHVCDEGCAMPARGRQRARAGGWSAG